MSPRLRSTRLAESGMVQLMPPVRRRLPRMSATISTPARPMESLPMPGSGMLDGADQETERHADADGDVAELRRPLDGVAEAACAAPGNPCGCANRPTRSPNSSTRSGRASRSLSPRRTCRTVEPLSRRAARCRRAALPTTLGLRGEDPQVVEVAAVLDEGARARLRRCAWPALRPALPWWGRRRTGRHPRRRRSWARPARYGPRGARR